MQNVEFFLCFLWVFEGGYTMRVCIGEGRERVACSLLYPIFKFGWGRGGNTTWECVFLGWDFLWGKWGGVLWICKNKCNFAYGKLRDFFAYKWHKFSLTDCFFLTEFTEHTEIIYCLRNKLPFGVVFLTEWYKDISFSYGLFFFFHGIFFLTECTENTEVYLLQAINCHSALILDGRMWFWFLSIYW